MVAGNGTLASMSAAPMDIDNDYLPSSTSYEEPMCIHVSDAIRATGIDDLTSWIPAQLLFALVYGSLFALGVVGNGGVLWVVSQNRRLRSARNIFLLNLILTDLLLCFTAVPVTPWYALSKEWLFGKIMCHAMPLSNSCAVFVTSWSLTAIAIDKFVHINDPTREPFSIKLAAMITVLIWLVCSLINIPYLLSYELVEGSYYVQKNATPFCGKFCDEINWRSETHRRLYGSTVMLFQFVIPLTIIVYCYWRILAKVHKDSIITSAHFSMSLSTSQRVDAMNRKKRVNYILIGMVLAFIGCWLPMTAVNLSKDFKQEPSFIRTQPYLWPLIAHAIAMSTIIWNPLLFFWLTRKQKRSNLDGVLHTSEIITSLASRVHSLKSLRSTRGSTNETRLQRKKLQQMTGDDLMISDRRAASNGLLSREPSACGHSQRPLLLPSSNGPSTPNAAIATTNGTTIQCPPPRRLVEHLQSEHSIIQKSLSSQMS